LGTIRLFLHQGKEKQGQITLSKVDIDNVRVWFRVRVREPNPLPNPSPNTNNVALDREQFKSIRIEYIMMKISMNLILYLHGVTYILVSTV
jgi:hypothetical protein